MVGVAPHNVGDMVKFQCDPGYMMEGQPIATCIEEKNIHYEKVGTIFDVHVTNDLIMCLQISKFMVIQMVKNYLANPANLSSQPGRPAEPSHAAAPARPTAAESAGVHDQ